MPTSGKGAPTGGIRHAAKNGLRSKAMNLQKISGENMKKHTNTGRDTESKTHKKRPRP